VEKELRSKPIFLILIFILLAIGPGSPAQADEPAKINVFEPAECMFEFPIFSVIPPGSLGFECGFVTVPEQHENPEGSTLRLAVAVLPSAAENPAPDPLFLAQGGPGGSSLEIFPFLAFFQGQSIRAERDIVIFDQRGTLYSEPNLICPEIDALVRETIDLYLPPDEAERRTLAAYQACGERLTAEGINLAAFNTLENAADIESVRRALGYDKINYYGVSYGTLLGLQYMRSYPDSLRSVILDAVVPTQGSFLNETAVSAQRAFEELTMLCAADIACNTAYPHLEDVIFEVVDRLNENPISVPVIDPDTGQTYQAVVDGDLFISILFQTMYSASLLPALPAIVYNTRDWDYEALSTLLPFLLLQTTFSQGMYQTVVCAEDSDFDPEMMPDQGVRPQLVRLMKQDNKTILAICRLWRIPYLGAAVNEPVFSRVPTLLLSGQFDPITPPGFAEIAARTLPNSYLYTFPDTSHGAAFGGSFCADQILLDFLANPGQPPAAGCIDAEPIDVDFPTPATVIMTPALQNILGLFEGQNLGSFGLMIASLAGLLSFIPIWPALYLIRLLFKRPTPANRPHPAVGCSASLLVFLMASLSLLFVISLFGLILSNNEATLLLGIPRTAIPFFTLPPLLLLLSLAMLLITAAVWLHGYWSVWRRLYYSLLTLSALLFTAVLIRWEMLTVLI
jgi:pimeloyl-ACP methyl ester carboxylesterase